MVVPKAYVYPYKLKSGERRYYYQVEIGKNKNGGIKYKKRGGFHRRDLAEVEMSRMRDKVMNNEYRNVSDEIFKDYAKEWLDIKRSDIAPATYEKYDVIIRTTVLGENKIFAHKTISNITPEDIRIFYRTIRDYSQSYLREVRSILRQMFSQAKRDKKIQSDPTKGEELPRSKQEQHNKIEEIKVWRAEEINEFLEASKDERLHPVFYIILNTGMRRGEALGLRWKYVDLKRGYIYLREGLTKDDNGHYTIGGLKTKKSPRDIEISERVISYLKELKRERQEEAALFGREFSKEDLVIQNSIGGIQEPRRIQKVIDRIVSDLDIERITCHGFRHTHATLLL